MLEQLDQCPLCNSGHFSNFMTCKDYTVTGKNFNLVTCDNCGLVFTNPRPPASELQDYYKSDTYISHANKANSLINGLYKIARKYTLSGKLKRVNKTGTKGHILDIGCGTGHFLEACKNDGWSVDGVEPDPETRKKAQELTGREIKPDIYGFDGISYNVITLWHVLEHIIDLDPFMQKVRQLLKSNGTLIIAVPNFRSYDARHYGEYWAAYDVPRHLYHFDQASLTKLMDKYDLNIKKISPMKLDSFYVSMLSEGYKGNHLLKYPRALLNGFLSNSHAKKEHNNYSSLIYTIQN